MSGAGRDLGRACGWLAVGLWAAAAGCNALLDIDHIEFRDLSVAAAGAAGAGGRGTGGSGGTGGGTGLAGGGGSGAGGGCVVAACPGVDTDCKHRICVEGQCGLLSDEKGKPCSHGRAPGYCDGEGECVECVHSGQCADGEICQQNQCVPKSCINGAPDPGETDVDCGGEKCPSCADGQKCQDPSDCQSKFCSEPGAGGNGGAGGANYCAPCQGEQDCALSPGTYCQGGKCVGKKAPGESCAAAAQCSSGFCPLQDGLCCNAACDGACQACRLDKSGQANGVCAPVAAGEDPDEECSAQGPQSCGADGSGCSGEAKGPGCRLYAKGTGCKAQSCTGGVLSAAGQCDGQGQCVPGQQSSCAPYGCDGQGKLCLTNCAQKQDCAGGHYCDGASKCVPEKAKGKSCAGDGQCATAHCADGFCCEVACSGSCEACDLPGLAGTCTLVPLGQNPGGKECAASQACDGAGACKTLAGKACQSGGECLSGFCPPQDELCCASACAGPCQACLAAKTGGKDGVCAALKGSTDPDKECPDLGAAQCKSNGSGCNGDALAPGCKLYGADVVCKAASCSGGVQTPAGKCDGKGGCTSGGQSACSPYTCNLAGTACLAQCGGDGDCAAGFYCWGGQCVKKKTSGQSCAGAKECQSGYCVDGLCCAGPCVGACDGCNLPAYEGSCKLRAKGSPGSPSCGAYLCSGQGAACPASCASDEDCATGYYCDQAKECVALKPDGAWCLSQHECLSAHCVDSYCCEQDCAGACDACNLGGGKGSCKPVAKGSAGSPSCAPYKCDGQSGACASSCASDGDCAGGYYCDEGNNCVPFKALGVACAQGKECLSGFCVDGYCCEQACAGACDGCNLMGYEGTCKLRGKGAGGSPSCAPYKCDGQSASCPKSCQEGGDCAGGYYCNGAKECKALEPDAAPCLGHHECQSAHCIDGYCCDGACAEPCDACNLGGKQGTCALVPQGAAGSPSCAPYRCGGQSGACASSCASDGDCAQGYYCDGANKCVPFKALGVACAQGKECLSGICVDGYCCDGACGGACDACNLGGKLGTCGPLAKGAAGSPSCAPYLCNGQSAGCPVGCAGDGDCAGGNYCDQDKKCVPKKSTGASCLGGGECSSGFCADGVCCDKACAGACDGCKLPGFEGTCQLLAKGAAGSPSCAPYLCNGQGASCPSSCASDGDCAAQAYCSQGSKCEAKKSQGVACAQAKECLSGFCVDGYCCNEICNGFCKACSAAKSGGQNGTCAFIPGGNPDNECPPGQQCDGQGACKVGCGVAPIPPGGACPGVCTGGCVDGGKTCAIDCFGGTCQNTTVNCPAGFACKVACQGPGACSGATINCPGIYACNITCQGIGPVCNNTTFNCSSGPCTLDCLMGAEPSCFGATLNCGSDACTANCDPPCGPPAVLCNQSCQCQDNCLPP